MKGDDDVLIRNKKGDALINFNGGAICTRNSSIVFSGAGGIVELCVSTTREGTIAEIDKIQQAFLNGDKLYVMK